MATIRTTANAIAWLKAEGLYEGLEWHDHDGEPCVVEHHACYRCGGTGNVGIYWVQGGVCFACAGDGHKFDAHVLIKKYAQKLKRARNAAAKRHAKDVILAVEREERMLEGQCNWCEANGHGRITFKERDAIRAAKKAEAAAAKTWVGTVGKREEFDVRVLATPSWETAFGYHIRTTVCVIMETPEGNKVIWKATGFLNGLKDGVTARIKGTIKEHGERDGEKQTVLTRVAVLEVTEPVIEQEAA